MGGGVRRGGGEGSGGRGWGQEAGRGGRGQEGVGGEEGERDRGVASVIKGGVLETQILAQMLAVGATMLSSPISHIVVYVHLCLEPLKGDSLKSYHFTRKSLQS